MTKDNTMHIFGEGFELMYKKNNDYTGNNVDNISITGVHGIAVRLLDKVSRLYNLSKDGNQKVLDESIRDTLLDIMNYGNIGVQLLDGTWTEKDLSTIKHQAKDLVKMMEGK